MYFYKKFTKKQTDLNRESYKIQGVPSFFWIELNGLN